MRLASLILAFLGLVGGAAKADTDVEFSFSLEKPATTSAGVFDKHGRVVRVLWEMKHLEVGKHKGTWDGKDTSGVEAPAGEYLYKVVVNRSVYRNVGAIGNSGRPPNEKGHTPTNMESVAVDSEGNVYTANGWDEAGADFKSWDAAGNSRFDAQYQIRNGRPNGVPYAIAVDDQYIYCALGGWEREPWNHRQQIQRFRLADGKRAPFSGKSVASSTEEPKGQKPPRQFRGPGDTLLDGHIQVYEWPRLSIPKEASEADARLMASPLRALAVRGETIYVADALGGKIRRYHKETGLTAPGVEIAVPLPHALAVDAAGKVWVGHEHGRVTAFAPGGEPILRLGDLKEVTSLYASGNLIFATDSELGHVLMPNTHVTPPAFNAVLGLKAAPGDSKTNRFFGLRGVAVDPKGNLVTIDRHNASSGAVLTKWSPNGEPLWQQFAMEFVSLGNYGIDDPDALFSMTHHRYRLGDRSKGQWEYAGFAYDPAADYRSDPHGVIRVLRIKGNDFVFMPTGDGVQVYRVDGGVLRLASMLGGNDPDPRGGHRKSNIGKWSWSDVDGTGKPDPATIRVWDDHYTCFGMDVDRSGNVYFANTHTHSIWTMPMASTDARGNPAYDWRRGREVVPRDASELGFEPNMAQAAEDESIYAFGWSKRWPVTKDNPFWMGGTTLCRFDKIGRRLWAVNLPHTCVGMDVIPGRAGAAHVGVMVGRGRGAEIYHYTPDGMLIGQMQPGEAMGGKSGWLDNHASVAVNRDPRDGVVDVFTEDDYTLRIGWYRVNDGDLRTISGVLVKR